MKNRCEIKVVIDALERSIINEERIYRDIARKMVSEIPLNELKKLIDFTKINPLEDNTENIFFLNKISLHEFQNLKDARVILYQAEINLP